MKLHELKTFSRYILNSYELIRIDTNWYEITRIKNIQSLHSKIAYHDMKLHELKTLSRYILNSYELIRNYTFSKKILWKNYNQNPELNKIKKLKFQNCLGVKSSAVNFSSSFWSLMMSLKINENMPSTWELTLG
jgi:hypothetical protein